MLKTSARRGSYTIKGNIKTAILKGFSELELAKINRKAAIKLRQNELSKRAGEQEKDRVFIKRA